MLLLWCSRVVALYRHDYKMEKVKGVCVYLMYATVSGAYSYVNKGTQMCKWGIQLFRQ
jgi:hypothetical protein